MAGTLKTNEVKLVSPDGLTEKTLTLGNDGVITIDAQVKQGGYYIVESGSNANGTYIKFSDGTLIQHGFTTFSCVGGTWGGSTVTFPISFFDTNTRITANFAGGGWRVFINCIGGSTTSFNLQTYNNDLTSTLTFGYIAIGRWR